MNVLVGQLVFDNFELLEELIVGKQALLDQLFFAILKPAKQKISQLVLFWGVNNVTSAPC